MGKIIQTDWPFGGKNLQKSYSATMGGMRWIRFFALTFSLVLFHGFLAKGEGVKELAPNADDRVYTRPVPNGFAYYDGPADQRLFFSISDPNNEQVFLGFSRPVSSPIYPCSGSPRTDYFRIKDPNGNVVFPTPGSNNGMPLNNANANITAKSQAMNGPNQIVGSGGYNAHVFDPAGLPPGDYYIEFSSSQSSPGSRSVNLEWWDITVATKSGTPQAINGRVFSKGWEFYVPRDLCNCSGPYGCFDKPFNGQFYVYSPADSVVSKVDFNGSGLQPILFNIFFNSFGTQNTGNVCADRKSVAGSNTFATEYPIFLNDPDHNLYPSGTLGTFDGPPFAISCDGQSGAFVVKVTRAGQVDVLIDLDDPGNFVFTPGTRDVALALKVEPLPGEQPPYVRQIYWNGKDGLGNQVDLFSPFEFEISYTQGVFHFPIYDAEYMLNGFNIQTIRPTPPPLAEPLKLYFDDSNISGNPGNGSPKVELNGCTPPCHSWSNFNFGNVNTINTWFFGTEVRQSKNESAFCLVGAVDDLDTTKVDLPVVLDVLANDLGSDLDSASVTTFGVLQPTNGAISKIDPVSGEITYTPNSGFLGVDKFEYIVCDTSGLICDTALVTIHVVVPPNEICDNGIDDDCDGLI
ncbi:MAG: hypothetical protein D6714_21285, partial [Bacteroidetes bacterium]